MLRLSWDAWEQVGNVSSVSVFAILRQLQEAHIPRQGVFGLMLAFGSGLTCELALLRWHEGLLERA